MLRLYRACVAMLRGSGLTRIRPVRALKEAALNRVTVNIFGHKMYVGRQDSLELIKNGVYEPFETESIIKTARCGDVVVDIGANIGYYTLQLARAVGENGHVYAFEPDRNNFSVLKRNVELNGYRNVTLINKAVGNDSGKLKLYVSDDNLGDHRAYDSGDNRRSYEVDKIALDEFGLSRVDLIKMDIQGYEPFALAGMRKVVADNPGLKMFTEFWPFGLNAAGTNPADYLANLRAAGFSLAMVDEHTHEIRGVSDAEILAASPNALFVNLLCSRS